MGLLPKSKKNDEGAVTCIKNNSSTSTSFLSAMLCFLHGFNDGDDKKNQKHLRFRLLRKSRASLKLLSTSSPTMTGQSQSTIPDTPKKEDKVPITSKSREKKFHRHFPSVESDEKVLNYYSCALIGDILLQGHLYITKNYFAFYSNVFGYVTKLLIPMLSVEKITKEKTARIIPNAVGISTADEKHVFGSLMSRDNTYKYMIKVWEISQKVLEESNIEPEVLAEPEILEIAASESDSSETKEIESEKECTAPFQINSTNNKNRLNNNIIIRHVDEKKQDIYSNFQRKLLHGSKYIKLLNLNFFILAVTFLCIILFISSSLLLYRINLIRSEYLSLIKDNNLMITDEDVFDHILRFSNQLHSKSANSINNYIDSNLNEIAKVHRDLELLLSILSPINDAKETPLDNNNS